MKNEYTLVKDQRTLEQVCSEEANTPWLCFDTEFVGEKRYFTRLCLIQMSTPRHQYIIDPFSISDLSPFLALIQDPGICKITHAGENDYRLLYQAYGILPQNVFDTQIASGFLGYRYPVSFKRLVEGELKISLSKSHTVANWETRPLGEKQLAYALEDIMPLPALWQQLSSHLEKKNRLHWAEEEFLVLEKADFYDRDPHQEALTSNLIRSLNRKERLFLLRLFEWRRKTAETKDYSKEMVLPAKLISHIVRAMRSGKDALRDNRRVPTKIAMDHWDTFMELYSRPGTPEELAVLQQVPAETEEDPREELLLEMLYLVIKFQCLENQVSPSMVLSRNNLKQAKNDPEFIESYFGSGWRKELLGSTFTKWVSQYEKLGVVIKNDEIAIRIQTE
ncbi:MAG: ribonuclease D [Lewinellaceae bacterium]|nr:ribonuclease D [Lewinellaceae bacterium]